MHSVVHMYVYTYIYIYRGIYRSAGACTGRQGQKRSTRLPSWKGAASGGGQERLVQHRDDAYVLQKLSTIRYGREPKHPSPSLPEGVFT